MKSPATIVLFVCSIVISLIALSVQDMTLSTSPLFMWKLNSQSNDNVYQHFHECKHQDQLPVVNINGPKIVLLQRNMPTEQFLKLSGAYEFAPSNMFPTLKSSLQSNPSEIYPTCETAELQIFDESNSKKLASVDEIANINFNTEDETFYIIEHDSLFQLDDVVEKASRAVSEATLIPVTMIVMAADSQVSRDDKLYAEGWEALAQSMSSSVSYDSEDIFVNTLYTNGAVAGGTLVMFLLLFILGIAIYCLLNLRVSPHITDDFKVKDLKKNQ